AVARLGEAFGMRIAISERPGADRIRPGRKPLEEVLEISDYLTLHCPLTDATHGLINADTLARMKPGAVLINTARGAIVDAHALIDALERGVIAGAGIDVLDNEPPRDGHPLIDHKPDNLIITPHT